jgi:hypothetical protein
MLLAMLVLIVLVFVFINLGVVIKILGAGLMVVPSALGIVHQVGPQEVFTYDLRTNPTMVGIGQPGRYAVYAYDYDLLTTSDQIDSSGAPPWITLESQATGEKVPVAFVKRGLRPYDTPLAKGRPALSFVITQPGIYIMRHPARLSVVSIVRDYVTGKERLLTAVLLIEIALVSAPVSVPLLRRYLARRQARRRSQQETRQRADAFWQREERRAESWRKPK